MKPKRTEIKVQHPHEVHPVRIVADAAVSIRGFQGGRMLPVLLLDTSGRPDIEELIRIHETLGPGDVKAQWGQPEGHEGTVALFLTFIRPMEIFILLEFDIAQQGLLVTQILAGRGLYLTQARQEDDRLMKNIDRPEGIVEVPDMGFGKVWSDLFHKHPAKYFRNVGLSRADSHRGARSAIEELLKFN